MTRGVSEKIFFTPKYVPWGVVRSFTYGTDLGDVFLIYQAAAYLLLHIYCVGLKTHELG